MQTPTLHGRTPVPIQAWSLPCLLLHKHGAQRSTLKTHTVVHAGRTAQVDNPAIHIPRPQLLLKRLTSSYIHS